MTPTKVCTDLTHSREERIDGMMVELRYVNLMMIPLSLHSGPSLIPSKSDRTKLRNHNRIYCNIPLRVPLHCKGDSYNAASGNTKGGFM